MAPVFLWGTTFLWRTVFLWGIEIVIAQAERIAILATRRRLAMAQAARDGRPFVEEPMSVLMLPSSLCIALQKARVNRFRLDRCEQLLYSYGLRILGAFERDGKGLLLYEAHSYIVLARTDPA